MPVIKASVVQTCTASYSLPETLEKLNRFTALAKERDGSQLCVFPEAFIGGYPRGSSFGTVIGERTPEGREEFLRYYNSAITVPSDATAEIESVAKRYDVFLVVGIIERDGGTLYCTIIFVDPNEGLVGKHRKLMPTATERLVWGMGDASTLPVLDVTAGSQTSDKVTTKVAAAICWESYMPLLRTYYYSKGVQLYCAPTVDSRAAWQSTMTHIALEGRCFVLSACQFALQKDFPAGHALPVGASVDSEGVMIGGGSVIVGPLGDVLAGPLRGSEGVLTASLELDDIVRGKMDLDCVGHYARRDVFELVFKA